jgi:integrase
MKRYEIIEAKRKDYKIVGGVALIYLSSKQGKNGRSFVKLSRGGMSALNDYLVLRDDDNPYLFRSHKYAKKSGQLSVTFFDQMFKRILKKTGLDHEGITPNCLRQTAGILNLMRGGTLSQTYTLLRHARIQSTLVYEDHLKRMKDDSEAALEAFILSEAAIKSYQSLVLFLDD